MTARWTNWSGSVVCQPRELARPASEAAVLELIGAASANDRTVRVTGTGHSFTPLCATDDVLLSLDDLQGLIAIDPVASTATLWAGTKIARATELLLAAGWSLENQGDVDVQSLAGAVSTGTHGTGPRLGSLSTQVAALRIATADGRLVDCSPAADASAFRAAQVSFGILGVITAVTLRVLPAYRLHERLWQVPIDDCLAELPTHIAAHRHFEFFWYPTTDLAHMKALDPTDEEPAAVAGREGERVDYSGRIFPTVRERRFNEIEYALPAAAGPECFADVRRLMRDRFADVTWPVEYRTLAADDIWLSPAYGRETVTISVHDAADRPFAKFFAAVEAIFRRYDGRPHWGKIHTLSAAELGELYPRWDDAMAVRRRIDPAGRFLNEHLRRVVGEA
ncbi:MAG: FAD-binding protein [Pirellulales bacterium]|nr:FAD-binding protein [Pirellulales bacterium]